MGQSLSVKCFDSFSINFLLFFPSAFSAFYAVRLFFHSFVNSSASVFASYKVRSAASTPRE